MDSVAGNGRADGLGAGAWRYGQSYNLGCGLDWYANPVDVVMVLLVWVGSVSPTVGNRSDIIPRSLQVSRLRKRQS